MEQPAALIRHHGTSLGLRPTAGCPKVQPAAELQQRLPQLSFDLPIALYSLLHNISKLLLMLRMQLRLQETFVLFFVCSQKFFKQLFLQRAAFTGALIC